MEPQSHQGMGKDDAPPNLGFSITVRIGADVTDRLSWTGKVQLVRLRRPGCWELAAVQPAVAADGRFGRFAPSCVRR